MPCMAIPFLPARCKLVVDQRRFGPSGFGLPQHGFVRKSNDWELVGTGDGEGHKAEFVLKDTEATRSTSWPHPFELRYCRADIGTH